MITVITLIIFTSVSNRHYGHADTIIVFVIVFAIITLKTVLSLTSQQQHFHHSCYPFINIIITNIQTPEEFLEHFSLNSCPSEIPQTWRIFIGIRAEAGMGFYSSVSPVLSCLSSLATTSILHFYRCFVLIFWLHFVLVIALILIFSECGSWRYCYLFVVITVSLPLLF